MPQIRKGGKHVFGYAEIRDGLRVQLPPDACAEYGIACPGTVIVFSGSKQTGGLCVTTHALLRASKLRHILADLPKLDDKSLPEGEFIPYKGRFYAWLRVDAKGVLTLSEQIATMQALKIRDRLMVIRSSDIACTMGAKGTLLEAAADSGKDIPIY